MNPFLDKREPIEVKVSGNLPHWHQIGKIQFITFRLADSLPQSKVKELNAFIAEFNAEHPKPWNISTTQKFRATVGRIEERLLDNGYGSCILQYPELREVIASAITYYSPSHYSIIAYAIMPNHVHLLVHFHTDTNPERLMQSIKSYSAHQINLKLQKTGSVWMSEYFDRIVRSENDLQKYINYIENNPQNLDIGKSDLYINPEYKR